MSLLDNKLHTVFTYMSNFLTVICFVGMIFFYQKSAAGLFIQHQEFINNRNEQNDLKYCDLTGHADWIKASCSFVVTQA